MSKAVYTHGSIEGTMLKTGAAMLPATLAISGYNIADTYFVSQLGTIPLAAMGFTFPLIMLIGCVNRGLAVGVTTPLAHGLGGGKVKKAAKIVSAGLLLVIAWSASVAIIGSLTINWVFTQFGADPKVMPLISDYMTVWYLGGVTGALAMTCNDVLIASGRSKTASIFTMTGMGLNVILDPLFIFGWGPIPAMGIRGAAIATVLSQLTTCVILLTLLQVKLKLISFAIFRGRILRSAWQLIIRMAIPACVGTLMMPLGNSIMTRIIASFGNNAVAACAAAGRLEIIAFIIPMALGISLTPIVAQNFGGKHYDRINHCQLFSMSFAFIFELVMVLLFFIAAPWIARGFSDNPEVIEIMTLYLRIIPWGFGMMEIHRYSGFFFTGCNNPKASAWLNGFRIVGLLIPLSLLALHFQSMTGLFVARLAADCISGFLGIILVHRLIKRLMTKDLPKATVEGPVPVPVAEPVVD